MGLHLVCIALAGILAGTAAEPCSEPTIIHGSVSGQLSGDSYFGHVTCHPGYQLVGGSGKVKCRRGRWSPMELPVCAKPGSCSPLPPLPRGRTVPVRGARGAAIRFKCRRDFSLFGPRTTFCQDGVWSHKSLPVCVASTCEEEGRMGIPYGEARALLGGGVYKYRCNSGLSMEGSDTVFCDGGRWNSSVPVCLVPPTLPQLEVPELVSVGDQMTVSCHATGGNPLPTVSITVGGHDLGESAFSRSLPVHVTEQHHGQEVVCQASSSAGTSQVSRILHVLSAPLTATVTGPTTLHHDKDSTYTCEVSGGRPTPTVRWMLRDSQGEEWEEEGEEEGVSTVTVSPVPGSLWVEVSCLATNPQGEARGQLRGHTHFLPSSVEVSSSLAATTPGSSLTFSCAALRAFPAPRVLWRAELAGERTIVLEEEGELSTETQEDGTVSTYSTLKVEVSEGVRRVRAECRALGEDMGERRSQWRTVFVWPALSSPNMEGLHAGATVSPGDIIPLSCSVDFTHEAEFITWLVDGQIQGEDYHLVRQGDSLTSQWNFLPKTGQSGVECRANGNEELSDKTEFTMSLPADKYVEEVKEEAKEENAFNEDTIKEEDVVEEVAIHNEVEEKAVEAVFWVPQESSSSSESSWPESPRSSQVEAEEEYQRAEKVPEVSAHSLKKTDMDLSVRDRSFSSSGISLSSSLLLPVILSLALLRAY